MAASKDAFGLLDIVLPAAAAAAADDGGRHARPRSRPAGPLSRAGRGGGPALLRHRLRRPAGRGTGPGTRSAGDAAVPAAVVAGQLRGWPAVLDALASEGFAAVLPPGPVALVPAALAESGSALVDEAPLSHAVRPAATPLHLAGRAGRDGGHAAGHRRGGRGRRLREPVGDGPLPSDPGHGPGLGGHAGELDDARLPGRVHRADAAGHDGQRHHVPQRRPPGEDRRDARRPVRRAGSCAGWGSAGSNRSTPRTAGTSRPGPTGTTLLEDALQLLPLLWGPGTPAFSGRVLNVPEAMCYPRPLQDRLPILVGGSGERTHAAAGGAVRRRLQPVRRSRRPSATSSRSCDGTATRSGGTRPPSRSPICPRSSSAIRPTGVDSAVERLRPKRMSADRFAERVNAGTVDQHIGRFEELAGPVCRRRSSACRTSRSPSPSPASAASSPPWLKTRRPPSPPHSTRRVTIARPGAERPSTL